MLWAIFFRVRFKAGNGNLQAVVIDGNLIPPKRMHLLVGHVWVNSWIGCYEACEGFQKGRNERGVHTLGFQPINQEQFEIFYVVAFYNKKGGL